MQAANSNQHSNAAVQTIIKAGLLAGTLDITTAFIHYHIKTGKGPFGVLNFVASGFFGKAAFEGGTPMALWGLLFHFIIAFAWTIIFFFLYPSIHLVSKNKIVNGLLYGIVIWAVMNLAVLPLSNVPPFQFDITKAIIAMLILMLAVGLPVSIIISRYYEKNKIAFEDKLIN